LDEVFELGLQLVTTDLVVAELDRPKGDLLVQRGLKAISLSGAEVGEILQLRARHRRLSFADLSALLLARKFSSMLLTGDRRLRKLAKAHGLEVHGILWVLEELVRRGTLKPARAARALEAIIQGGARLPREECRRLLQKWQA